MGITSQEARRSGSPPVNLTLQTVERLADQLDVDVLTLLQAGPDEEPGADATHSPRIARSIGNA